MGTFTGLLSVTLCTSKLNNSPRAYVEFITKLVNLWIALERRQTGFARLFFLFVSLASLPL